MILVDNYVINGPSTDAAPAKFGSSQLMLIITPDVRGGGDTHLVECTDLGQLRGCAAALTDRGTGSSSRLRGIDAHLRS